MIALKLNKVYFKDGEHLIQAQNEGDADVIYEGFMEYTCDNQNIDELLPHEQILVKIENIPFISFRILNMSKNKFHVMSNSVISLKTYTEQGDRVERWGEFLTIGQALNKVISVVAGFINHMGKEKINDGNYYQN